MVDDKKNLRAYKKTWADKERSEEIKHKKRLIKEEHKKKVRQDKYELSKMRSEYRSQLPLFRMQTTKLITLYLFILMNGILGYCLYEMNKWGDLSYLGALITDICGQIVIFFIYAIKAFKETKEAEIQKTERFKAGAIDADAFGKAAKIVSGGISDVRDVINDSIDNINGTFNDYEESGVIESEEDSNEETIVSDGEPVG